MLMNPTPQISTVSIFFYPLEPIVLCIQENCMTKNVERINRKKIQINQSQPTIDIAAKLTRLPENFSIQSAVPLAIILFSVFSSCSQYSSDWWHLRKMPTSSFPPSLTCILDTHQTLTELCGPSRKCWSPQSAINHDLLRLLSELDKK